MLMRPGLRRSAIAGEDPVVVAVAAASAVVVAVAAVKAVSVVAVVAIRVTSAVAVAAAVASAVAVAEAVVAGTDNTIGFKRFSRFTGHALVGKSHCTQIPNKGFLHR